MRIISNNTEYNAVFKHIITFVIVAAMILATANMDFVFAEDAGSDTDNNVVEYNETIEGGSIYFDKTTGTVIGGDMSITKLDIPAEIEETAVETVKTRAFWKHDNITELTYSPGVWLEADSFLSCDGLTEVIVPEGVTRFELFPFQDCKNITKIYLSSTVKSVQGQIPNLKEFIADKSNTSLTAVDGVIFNISETELVKYPAGKEGTLYTVPETVKTISSEAFRRCNKLKEIVLPEGVVYIESSAFDYSTIEEVNLPESLKEIEIDAFYNSKIKSAIIPEGVTEIKSGTFVNCSELEEVIILNGEIKISEHAFTDERSTNDEITAVICGYPYSKAEAFATEHGLHFEYINGAPQIQSIMCCDVINKAYGAAPFKLDAEAETEMTYESDNVDVADVSEDGDVTVGVPGVANITLKAKHSRDYKDAEKIVTIYVTKADPGLKVPIRSYNLIYGCERFNLNAVSNSEIEYSSSNKTVAKVAKDGVVGILNPGKATITITSPETYGYEGKSTKVKLDIKLKNIKATAKAYSGKKNKVSWTKVPGADGYQVYVRYPGAKKFTFVVEKSPSVKAITHKGLKAGKSYKYKIRAYRNVKGEKVYTNFSETKTVKVKK